MESSSTVMSGRSFWAGLREEKVFIPLLVCIFIFHTVVNLWLIEFNSNIGLLFIVFIESVKILIYLALSIRCFKIYRREKVLGWLLIGIGCGIWVPGQFTLALLSLVRQDSYVSGTSADTVLFTAVLFAVSGIITTGFYNLSTREKVRASLNALSLGACITFVAMVFLAYLASTGRALALDEQWLNLLYFTFDVMLISFPIATILFRRFDSNTLVLGIGMCFLAVSDIVYITFLIRGVESDVSVVRSIQFVGTLCWVFVASRDSMKPSKQPTIRGENYLTVGVNLVVVVTIMVAAIGLPKMEEIPLSVSYSFILVFIVVLTAQLVGHFENKRLQKIQSESIQTISKSEEKFQELATHDSLTQLNNRAYFIDALREAMDNCENNDSQVGVLFVDLDRFKEINDSYGHSIGDIVISELARRIKHVVEDRGLVCRLGGDEFAVLVTENVQRNETLNLAKEILRVSTDPIEIMGSESYLSCSIGIAFSEGTDLDSQTILRNADAAMYRAKELGRNRVEFADDVVCPVPEMSGWTLSELHRAIVDNQIQVFYQPIYNLVSNTLVGFEALARWDHPSMGMIPPDEFIVVAEDNGLIIDIGNRVISQALRQLRKWDRRDISININLSFRQLNDSGLIEFLLEECSRNNISPSSIIFEMTESALLGDVRNAISTLNEIRQHGFNLHIDDFGTGYSSLSYLKKFPIDGFKIDRAYVEGYGKNEDDTAIVNALVGLGKSMGLVVTAEGVSSATIKTSLTSLGCTFGQGYFYSKALAPSDIVLPKLIHGETEANSLKSA